MTAAEPTAESKIFDEIPGLIARLETIRDATGLVPVGVTLPAELNPRPHVDPGDTLLGLPVTWGGPVGLIYATT